VEHAPEPCAPGIAVVIPTHSRSHLLPRLFAGLEAQLGGVDFEVVIVDDASTDDTVATVERLTAQSKLNVRLLRQPRNRGPATARNVGWRSTPAGVIAFTDDDCTPEAGWLEGLLAGLTDADIAQGRTVADPDELDRTGPFSRTLSVGHEDGFYQTCNIAYRRQVLESVGGFEEAFRFPAGEDTDLAWRARADGARTTFQTGAVVRHTVRPSNLLMALRDTWRWQSAPQAISRHPELRALIFRPYVWKPAHRLVLVALPGIALAVAAPFLGGWALAAAAWVVALALLAPYARHRVRRERLPQTSNLDRLLLLPATFVLDGAEVVACVVGSVRYRTLLL
jgi:glycosyltransferase involved in cell wall biosynthesis